MPATRVRFAAAIVLLPALLAVSRPARALDLVVSRFDDPAPSSCEPGDCSLREAVLSATAIPGADRVLLGAGTYVLTRPGFGTDFGDLDVAGGELTLAGAGAGSTIVDGNGIDRILFVQPEASVVATGITFRNGHRAGPTDGGAILSSGALTLVGCVVEDSSAGRDGGGIASGASISGPPIVLVDTVVRNNSSQQRGGGIISRRPLALSFSSVLDNTAGGDGGGIHVAGTGLIADTTIAGNVSTDGSGGGVRLDQGATLDSLRSTISDNLAEAGGGIYNGGGTVRLTDSTLTANTASGSGGGLFNLGSVVLASSTLASNLTTGNGGGLLNGVAGSLTARNTLIADNVDLSPIGEVHPDCSGTISSAGHNLVEQTAGCTIQGGDGDLTGVDPALGLHGEHGGPTRTRPLTPGSPAIDAGDPTGCADATGGALGTDQRSAPRTFDGDGDQVPVCDIGAFELVPGFLFADGFESGGTFAWSAALP